LSGNSGNGKTGLTLHFGRYCGQSFYLGDFSISLEDHLAFLGNYHAFLGDHHAFLGDHHAFLGSFLVSWASFWCPGEVSAVLGRLAEVFAYPDWSNDTYELFCADPHLIIFYPDCLVCVGLRSSLQAPTFGS
jgi:hypothetical protein